MLATAVVVPAAPLLVPAVAGGSAAVDADLRAACRAAVGALDSAARVVVVGDAVATGPLSGGWDFTGFGVPARSGRTPLPPALAVGDWLLDDAGSALPREHLGVAAATSPDECAALGRSLAAGGEPVGLLLAADGSARGGEKAPGSLDPRAAGFDETVAAALRRADPAALLALDAHLGRELMAAGRASWQVLAGAAEGAQWQCTQQRYDCPYGVGYFVAVWRRAGDGEGQAGR